MDAQAGLRLCCSQTTEHRIFLRQGPNKTPPKFPANDIVRDLCNQIRHDISYEMSALTHKMLKKDGLALHRSKNEVDPLCQNYINR